MGKFEGIAAMYMSMPMAQQGLPILGHCHVEEKKISLKFPLSGISFDLPSAPAEGSGHMDFKMTGARGEMSLHIQYLSDLKAFLGEGKQDGHIVLTFLFYSPGSPLKSLQKL